MDDDETEELQQLRGRVHVLEAGLGLTGTFSIPVEVRRAVDAGRTVDAVRELRRRAPGRLRLVAAKRMVDALQR